MKLYIVKIVLISLFITFFSQSNFGYTNPNQQNIYSSEIEWSSNGTYLAVYYDTWGTCVYDGQSFSTVWQIGNDTPITDFAFSRDEETFITSHEDGQIRFWNLTQKQLLKILDEHETQISSVSLNANGTILALSEIDEGFIKIFDFETMNLIHEFTIRENARILVRELSFFPIQNKLAILVRGGIAVYDISDFSEFDILTEPSYVTFLDHLSFSLDETIIASATHSPFVAFWNLQTQKSSTQRIQSVDDISLDIAFSPDGNLFAVLTGFDIELYEIEITDEAGLEYLSRISLDTAEKMVSATRIAFSPDSEYLATTGEGITQIWNIETGEIEHTLDDCQVES